MAALVVVSVTPTSGSTATGSRIGIFPGGVTPTMYPADTPFWVGYGFAADPESEVELDETDTRFELDVDGEPVPTVTDVQSESGRHVRTTTVARFPDGLSAGWHDLVGRWYDSGRLILSSRAAIEFVER